MAIDWSKFTHTYLECSFRVGFWDGTTPPTEFYGPINFTKLGLTPPEQDIEALKSNMEGTVGQDLATVQKPKEDSACKVGAEFNRGVRKLMALAIGADVEELAVTGATKTDQAVTTVLNAWVPLPDQYLDSFTTLETSADVLVDAAKYEVDLVAGMIMAVHADAVGVGMKATYVTKTLAGVRMNAGKALSEYVMLDGTATEKVSQKRARLRIHRANLAPNGEWDPVAGGYIKGAVSGSCETPDYAGVYQVESPWYFDDTDYPVA